MLLITIFIALICIRLLMRKRWCADAAHWQLDLGLMPRKTNV
jgi:membrane protein required for beta-lactamase induction